MPTPKRPNARLLVFDCSLLVGAGVNSLILPRDDAVFTAGGSGSCSKNIVVTGPLIRFVFVCESIVLPSRVIRHVALCSQSFYKRGHVCAG